MVLLIASQYRRKIFKRWMRIFCDLSCNKLPAGQSYCLHIYVFISSLGLGLDLSSGLSVIEVLRQPAIVQEVNMLAYVTLGICGAQKLKTKPGYYSNKYIIVYTWKCDRNQCQHFDNLMQCIMSELRRILYI